VTECGAPPEMPETQRMTFARGSGQLDRAAHLREVADDLLRHRRAALLPLYCGRVLIDLEGDGPQLGWVPPLVEYLEAAAGPPVFLGLSGETPCFAADFTGLDRQTAEDRFCDGAAFLELQSIAGDLGPASAAIAATARGWADWHGRHRFCPRCGAASVVETGGWRRVCPECDAQHLPRTDPVVIMLVLDDDRVLVARQSVWRPGLVSLPAGYVEPGETIEDAVRREAHRQTGVRVGRVGYLASQPWPFPASLMIGCVAGAETSGITIDPDELEDARWISRAKMQVILDGKHPRMVPPRRDAIARAILDDWANGDVRLP